MFSRRFASIAALVCASIALAGSAAAAPPGISLLKDLYPGTDATRSSGAAEFAALGSDVLFRACDSEHGCELWKTDGTAVGTVLVADLWPGEGSGSPYGFVSSGTKVFFRAADGIQGDMLWVTDGTAAGTKMILRQFWGFLRLRPRDSRSGLAGSFGHGRSGGDLEFDAGSLGAPRRRGPLLRGLDRQHGALLRVVPE